MATKIHVCLEVGSEGTGAFAPSSARGFRADTGKRHDKDEN
jgi:hypothetical protein